MRPLTRREWEEHFTELRPYVQQEWPEIPRQRLEGVGDDFFALLELIQDITGLPAETLESQLKSIDVEELNIGTGGSGEAEEEGPAEHASLDLLRLSGQFETQDRERIVERLAKLDRRLKRFPADGTDLQLTVKDRDSGGQKVTLEAWLPKFGHFAATSTEPEMRDALMDVREDMWRQIDDAVNKRKGN